MQPPLIRAENLSIGHGTRVVARGIAFAVGPGDGVCVVGGNGAGKSTLLRTLLGLQPPLAGRIASDPSLRPGDIGYLPQSNPAHAGVPATAREVVLSGCQALRGLRPWFSRAERRLAEEALARFGAQELAGRPFRELSGGQRQRVRLARALCAGRRLLVLDEPVSGLDPGAAADLYRTLADLRREGRAVLSVTHDLPGGLADATHVLGLGPEPFFAPAAAWQRRARGVGLEGGAA
ncbi:MAG: metal ABC transporter ATP-binding protein [Kiritimatiellae bacterium]|nr:metal ABC transporter ATP-binding protein [Kiritimatiellia bacterium]